jgi:hypothetical protein
MPLPVLREAAGPWRVAATRAAPAGAGPTWPGEATLAAPAGAGPPWPGEATLAAPAGDERSLLAALLAAGVRLALLAAGVRLALLAAGATPWLAERVLPLP